MIVIGVLSGSCHQVLVPHPCFQRFDGGCVAEVRQQLITVREGGGWSFARREQSVDGDQLGCVLRSEQCLLESGIAGGAVALEQPQFTKDERCRADGSNSSACLGLGDERLTDALMLAQVGGSRHTTWQEQQVGVTEITVVKQCVGDDRHTVG